MVNFVKSPIHKAICFTLAFIFMLFLLLLPVSAEGYSDIYPDTIGWQEGDTFRDILLAVLDSWGISFSRSDSSDSTSILEYSEQLMQDFYDANNTTQEMFWEFVRYGVSETGKIILDFLGVNKIRQFANWLKDKFSLSDNSSVSVPVVNHGLFLPQLTGAVNYSSISSLGFVTNHYVDRTTNIAYANYDASSAPYTMVFCVLRPGTNIILHNYDLSDRPASISYWADSFQGQNLFGQYSLSNSVDGIYYYQHTFPNVDTRQDIPSYLPGDGMIPVASFEDALLYYRRVMSYQVTINTDVIDIPSQDMLPQDGLEIEVPGANWGDSLLEILLLIERLIGLYDNTQLEIVSIVGVLEDLIANLQTEVSVNNIPGGVVLDYDNYDVPLDSEWQIVDEFFLQGVQDDDTLFTPLDTLKYIIFGLPEPFIAFFSVIVIFTVAYGFIRMGRDSH